VLGGKFKGINYEGNMIWESLIFRNIKGV
jgi:hypothetical protein